MSEKRSKEQKLIDALAGDYPKTLRIAENFYWRGVHIFNSHTHQLNQHVEDKVQARIALRIVELMGKIHGRQKRLNADERKCLDGIGPVIPESEEPVK